MSETTHRPELDGLRGVAAYAVLLSHASYRSGAFGDLISRGGSMGVMIFFVLSGYLMGALYLGRPFNLTSVREYAVRRLARIAPLYLLVVFVSWAFTQWAARELIFIELPTSDLLAHLTFRYGADILWTIPVEVQFYAVFIGLWAIVARSRPALYALMALGIATMFMFDWKPMSYPYVDGLPFFAGWFLAGVALSVLPLPTAPRFWSALFVGLALTFVALYPDIYPLVFGAPRSTSGFENPWHDPLYLAVVCGLLGASLQAPLARNLLSTPALRWAGAISFSVYLLHIIVIKWLDVLTPLGDHPTAFVAVTLVITTAVASLCFVYVERPARAMITAALAPQKRRAVTASADQSS